MHKSHTRCTLVLCLCIGIHQIVGQSWHDQKASHSVKTLNAATTEIIAKLNDGDETYFKDKILQPFLRPRVAGSEGNHAVQNHIKEMMAALGWSIQEDMFQDETPFGRKNFTNIIVTHNTQATRKLVLACHFDSKFFEKIEFIGATDSAVPCAMMIDLAKQLQSYLDHPQVYSRDISLQLIFFDGEEAFVEWTAHDSLYGARHLAKKMENEFIEVDREVLVSSLDSIDVMVLLDLIGSSDTSFSNMFSRTEALFDHLRNIEKRLVALKVFGRNQHPLFKDPMLTQHQSGGVQDDHIPFLRKNVPILHLISQPFPSVWHQESDNESALDYQLIKRLSAILRIFVIEYLNVYLDV